MSGPILKGASDAIVAILADTTAGFNAQLASFWNQYQLTGEPWTVDFSEESANFFLSRLGILDLYEMEDFQLPGAALFEGGDANTNEVVTSTFAGPMVWIVEQHISIPSGDLRAFHRIRYAVHDAMFAVFNSPVPQPYFLGTGIQYAGRIAMAEPPPIISPTDDKGADLGDLLQTLSFRIDMDMVVG